MHTVQTLLSLLLKGGWLMAPLLLLSLVNIYVIVERLLTYRKYLNLSSSFLEELERQLNNANLEAIHNLCLSEDNIIKKVIYKGLQQRQAKSIELILESESNKIVAILEENLALLATISGAAPMIGFLGTVTGMIQTFMAIAHGNPHLTTQNFSGGIYEAMVTTAVGLVIGITAYLGYHYFVTQVNQAVKKVTYLVNLFLAKSR